MVIEEMLNMPSLWLFVVAWLLFVVAGGVAILAMARS